MRNPGRELARITLMLALVGGPGCASMPRPRVTDDVELQRTGAWTADDQAARQLLDQEGLPARSWPLRRQTLADEMLIEVGREEDPLLLPSPTRALGALLGFDQVNGYRYLPGQRGWVLLHPDRPPTLIADDVEGDRPRPFVASAPPAAFRELAESIRRDLEGVPPVGDITE